MEKNIWRKVLWKKQYQAIYTQHKRIAEIKQNAQSFVVSQMLRSCSHVEVGIGEKLKISMISLGWLLIYLRAIV